MAIGFIIMQIGNADLDRVCAEAIVPAIAASGLDAKRVDKHNTGGLLKSEIIGFIQHADIIVADLTNERPNCYLEVGYAMGLDKFRNLILTAREDHNLESPNHAAGGVVRQNVIVPIAIDFEIRTRDDRGHVGGDLRLTPSDHFGLWRPPSGRPRERGPSSAAGGIEAHCPATSTSSARPTLLGVAGNAVA